MTPKQTKLMNQFIKNAKFIGLELKKMKISSDSVWGIDISLSNTGLTIYNIFHKDYGCYSHKFKGSRYGRLLQLEQAFTEHIMNFSPKLVIIEGFAYGASQGREILGEAAYSVKRCFIYRGDLFRYPCLTIAPLSLKKFVVGKARGVSKAQIHKIVSKEWDAQTKNHDESDSFALCVLGQNIKDVCYMVLRLDEDDYEDFYKGKMIDIENYRWEVVRNVIMNDGENIRRFYDKS